jgi:putative oxidoreductase
VALRAKEALFHLGLFALRVGFGVQMAAFHGLEKLRSFSVRAGSFPDTLGIGHRNSLIVTVTAELFCAGLLVLGLASRLAALALSLVMGIALFVQQAPDPWKKKELAALYFGAFLTMLFLGPGKLSLDATLLPRLFRRGRGSAAGGRVSSPSVRFQTSR